MRNYCHHDIIKAFSIEYRENELPDARAHGTNIDLHLKHIFK